MIIPNLNETRGVITLSEPIYFENGTIAISKGSSLIVEVTSWERSGLVSLSASAISHDAQGKLPQQAIPLGTLLIKAKNHQPLIATTRHLNDNSEALDLLNDLARTTTNGLSRTITSILQPGSRKSNPSRDLLYELDAGTEVSVFVNNFTRYLRGRTYETSYFRCCYSSHNYCTNLC